jgi:predicted DNA binding protein
MFIENLKQILKNANFIEIKDGDYSEFFCKINRNTQLYAVSTDNKTNDLMFISEQILKNQSEKDFEDDNNNIIVHSEYTKIEDFWDVLVKYNLANKKYRVLEDTDLFDFFGELKDLNEDDEIELVLQDDDKLVFKIEDELFWQYNYTIEDKIEKIITRRS